MTSIAVGGRQERLDFQWGSIELRSMVTSCRVHMEPSLRCCDKPATPVFKMMALSYIGVESMRPSFTAICDHTEGAPSHNSKSTLIRAFHVCVVSHLFTLTAALHRQPRSLSIFSPTQSQFR